MNEQKDSAEAPARAWSVPVALEDIPETGRHVELEPNETARAAIAKLAGVVGLPRLSASFDLSRQGSDALRVVGSVSATVDQSCVVTLDPMQSEIEEAVDLLFAPHPEPLDDEKAGPLAVDADEPPEVLRGGVVDLGAIATEFLLLGIDPYPRKPEAVFDAPGPRDAADSPFAALAALKKKQGEKGS